MRRDPFPVFLRGSRIDHEQQMIFGETIDQQVVNDSAFGSGQRGILRLAVNEFGDVVGSNVD